jgi:hypothetical protein
MEQEDRRIYLIRRLLEEKEEYSDVEIPQDEDGQKRLLRGLMNVRMPKEAGDEFLRIQDEYLQEEQKRKGIVDVAAFIPLEKGICLWKGDITRAECGCCCQCGQQRYDRVLQTRSHLY